MKQQNNNDNNFTYSVVTAVYNIAPYLDDFFKSITKQSLDFESNIFLILIDDGSTDNSAAIIKIWKRKYPHNILHLRKENGGQASARNLGLTYVKTPWVTFIDPDDFVNKDYFKEVNNTLLKHKNVDISMIACNLLYYFEKYDITINKHPLREKFKTTIPPIEVKNLDKYIQLSASSAFFKTALIRKMQLQFDTRIKPNFEDAHFLNSYLITNETTSVIFLKEAIYYYRRRKNKTSTIDTTWHRPEQYNDILRFGYLDLFEKAKEKFGYIPYFVQRTILYNLSWYFKYMVDHPEFTNFLTKEKQHHFKILLEQLFNDISIEPIEEFDLSGVDDLIRAGWASYYKKRSLSKQTIYLSRSDKRLYIHYYSKSPLDFRIMINHQPLEHNVSSKYIHTFLNEPFIWEYCLEIPLERSMKTLSIEYNGEIKLHTRKRSFSNKIEIRQIEHKNLQKFKARLYQYAKKIFLGH